MRHSSSNTGHVNYDKHRSVKLEPDLAALTGVWFMIPRFWQLAISLIAVSLVMMLMVSACEEKKPVAPDPEGVLHVSDTSWMALNIGGEGPPIEVTNSTSTEALIWTAAVDVSWLSLSQYAGTTPDTISLRADSNTTGSLRHATITLDHPGLTPSSTQIFVSQPSTAMALCISDTVWIAEDTGAISPTITMTNCGSVLSFAWQSTVDANWITLSRYEGYTTQGFTISVDSNLTNVERVDTITVTADTVNGSPQYVEVRQPPYTMFYRPVHYPAGSYPQCVATADIDGDNDPDLAVSNRWTKDVIIMRNDGTGAFTQIASYETDSFPAMLVFTDIDFDNDSDLVIACRWNDSLTIRRNDGTGHFGARERYDIGTNDPIRVAAATFDWDDDVDLTMTTWNGDTLSTLFNDGTGVFDKLLAIKDGLDSRPCGLVAADLGNLDISDIAMTFEGDGSTRVWWSNGDGTFTAGSVMENTGSSPIFLEVIDINQDGHLDLVQLNAGVPTDIVFLINNGDATFTVGDRYAVLPEPRSLVVADFDNDGYADIATASWTYGSVTVLLNNGDGTLKPPRICPTGYAPQWVCSADFDGDGDMDIATANELGDNISILFNKTVP